MMLIARPEMIQIATLHGRPVGFAMCVPELNEALHAGGDRRLFLRVLRVLRALPNIQSAAFKLIGVIPELRGAGVDAALLAAVTRGAQAAGYQRLQGSVVDERNWLMRGVVESLGLRLYRVYRLYEKQLAA